MMKALLLDRDSREIVSNWLRGNMYRGCLRPDGLEPATWLALCEGTSGSIQLADLKLLIDHTGDGSVLVDLMLKPQLA